LIRTAEEFVASRGHPPDLFNDLVGGVFDRFGALVSRVQDTFEFEVQPLREYFAGYYLYETAPYSPTGRERKGTRPERLDVMLRHPFWLNVVRFYAGCYSVGELESLAGRLEALADDHQLRWTALPRTVTAQLLADWTLVQDQGARARAVAVILRDLGNRHAGSGEDYDAPYVQNRPISLPAKSGGSEFVDALFHAVAHGDMGAARLAAFARALSVNAPQGELAERWLATKSAGRPSAEERWWRLGVVLGIFRELSRDQVRTLLADKAWATQRLVDVISEGVFWLADESAANGAAAVDHVLEYGYVQERPESTHPLATLSKVVRLDHIAMSREGRYSYYDSGWTASSGSWPSHYDAVCAFVTHFDSLMQTRVQWLTQLEPWRDIVDVGLELFGEREAFDRLALVSSAVRDTSQRGGGNRELHDSEKSLVLRARYARYSAGAYGWWQDQIQGAPDQRSGDFAIALLLSWANSETMARLHPEVTLRLDSMSVGRYARLYARLHQVLALRNAYGARLAAVKCDTPSARLFVLLGLRRADRDSLELYGRHRYRPDHDDAAVISYFLDLELAAMGTGRDQDSWERVLVLLRRASECQVDTVYLGLRRTAQMPHAVAMAIVRDAEHFPLTAVYGAEERIADIAARKIPRVGAIAKRDGWL
jgi:hypothetical protein